MTKKLFKLALVGMTLALVLAACTPTGAGTTEPTEDMPATTEPTDEMPATTEATDEAPTEATDAPDEGGAFTAIAPLEAECVEGGSEFNKIEATGQYEVTFTLCRPDPAFLQKIAFSSFGIQSSEWLEETGGTGDLLEQPRGTGPYMVTEWNRGENIQYERNPNYWGDAPLTENLVFRWNSEAAARLLDLESGNVDGIDNPGTDDFEAIEGNPDLQLILRPALNIFYVGFTAKADDGVDTPLDDVRVRQAIAMGLDRQRIVDTFYPEGSQVASHFTPCSITNACVGEAWYAFDVAAAQALLDEAGYGDGFTMNIYLRDVPRSYLPQPVNVATDIQAQLAENLNITAEIVPVESTQFLEESSAGNYVDGIHLLGWGADYPQITNFLDFHFNADNPQFGDPHPEIYEALEAGAALADEAAAEPFYVDANNAIRELVPMIPIVNGASATAYRADVENAHSSPLGNEYFGVMDPGGRDTFVWMQNGEPGSLFCADQTDGEALRACEQTTESLLGYEVGGVDVVPILATGCEPNEDLTVWVCTLREGVTFHDDTTFDANDVVFNFSVFIDAANPLHVGNSGVFEYPAYFFGLINAEE